MRRLLKFFRRTPPSAEGRPEPGRPAIVDEDFRPMAWVYDLALDRVLEETEGLDPVRSDLRDILVGAGWAGTTAQEEAVAATLEDRDWSWPLLESLAIAFAREGRWPSSWLRYPSLLLPYHEAPTSVAEAVPYFTYLELRDILRPKWPAGPPFPIRLEDLQEAFRQRISWDQAAASALANFNARQSAARRNRPRDRACLLTQHLQATAASLTTFLQWERAGGNRFLSYRLEVTCPENETVCHPYRDRFNSGASEQIPPYFPADPSRLRLVRNA